MVKELLEHIKTIYPLSAESQSALSEICKEIKFTKGENIQDIGHTCKTIYFVKKGVVRIYYFKDATDITESFEFENSFVARAESLFTGKPSRKAIQAIEDTTLIAIDSNKLFKFFNSYSDLERMFRKIIESSYVNTVNRIESLQFNTAEERYKSLLKDAPDTLKRIPLKYIASYLGITQVSLSRIRGLK
ncbi:MAG: Crp/Fnr family transcriptional regulator [Bacteroidetes bacterium]|jgi:CRP-like cAMP-binding protein|nr:Crp/Fnr family transcriptional regulator [Bacteroidota bacterium]